VLRAIATTDLSPQLLAKERIDKAMDSLIAQNVRFQTVLAETAESSTQISGTINNVVTRIQFQDLAKQKLDAVRDSMAVVRAGLDELVVETRGAVPGIAGHLPDHWIDRVLDTIKLSEVRRNFVLKLMSGTALDEVGAIDVPGAPSEEGSIELF